MHLALLYKMHIDDRYLTSSFLRNIGFLGLVSINFLYESANMISVQQLVLPYNVMNKIETFSEIAL
jgi:hypothetical protein